MQELNFIQAASRGDLLQLQLGLASGVDINFRCESSKRRTALLISLNNGYHDCIEFLLKNNADPTPADKDGFTALHSAAGRDETEYMEHLIQNGADINATTTCDNAYGVTPLLEAIHCLCIDSVKKLIDLGADLHFSVPNGKCPLDEAIEYGNMQAAHLIRTAIAAKELKNSIAEAVICSTNEASAQRKRGPCIF